MAKVETSIRRYIESTAKALEAEGSAAAEVISLLFGFASRVENEEYEKYSEATVAAELSPLLLNKKIFEGSLDGRLYNALRRSGLPFSKQTESGTIYLDAGILASFTIYRLSPVKHFGETYLYSLRMYLVELAVTEQNENSDAQTEPIVSKSLHEALKGKWLSTEGHDWKVMNGRLKDDLLFLTNILAEEPDHHTFSRTNDLGKLEFNAFFLAQKSWKWFLRKRFAPSSITLLKGILERLSKLS